MKKERDDDMELIYETKKNGKISLITKIEDLTNEDIFTFEEKYNWYKISEGETKSRSAEIKTIIRKWNDNTTHNIIINVKETMTKSETGYNIKHDISFVFDGEIFDVTNDAINLKSLDEFVKEINSGRKFNINDAFISLFYLCRKEIWFYYNMPIVKKDSNFHIERLDNIMVKPIARCKTYGNMTQAYMVLRALNGCDRGEYTVCDRNISFLDLYDGICNGTIKLNIIEDGDE